MAGKKNERAAQTVAPEKDAAVATATDSTTELPVNAPAQEGGQENSAAPAEGQGEETPGIPATVTIQTPGGAVVTNAHVTYPEQAPTDKDGKVFTVPSMLTVEGTITYDPAEAKQFFIGVCELFAGILAEAGVLVRKDGQQVPPAGEHIMAASFGAEGSVIVTVDGRKFILKDGKLYEAQ